MRIFVKPHSIQVETVPVNELEINVTKCKFEFSKEITNEFTKEAYFTLDGKTYKQIIFDNKCDIPSEVLVKEGTIEIGVVAFNDEKRYNPTPVYITSWKGSLKEADNSEPVTPSEVEQCEREIQQAIIDLQNVDTIKGADGRGIVDIIKTSTEGLVDTYTIFYTDETTSTYEVTNGASGGGGSVDIDNSTITTNANDEIQTVGIIDRNTGNADKIWTGTTQQYNSIQNKDTNTFYYITDDDATLVSDIQINNNSIVSSGTANIVTKTAYNSLNNRIATENDLPDISGKQDTLVSGTNIKTINNTSLLGSGNITISGGGGTATDVQINGTSIVSNNTANIITNTAYNSSSNKIATMSDVPDISGKQDKIPVETSSQTTITIDPNKYYSFGEAASLNITLGTPTDNTIYNEYMFEFNSGATPTSLTLPNTVEWVQTPTIEASKTYQVSIVNNIGIIVGV